MNDIVAMTAEAEKELEALRKTIRDRSEEIMTKALSAFFAKHPQVKTVYWAQWIPGFNDGDACEFTLGDVNFSPRDAEEIDGPYAGDEIEDDTQADFGSSANTSRDLKDDMEAVSRFINGLEEHLEHAYGNNAFIRITATEVLVEDYDCGY